MHPDPFREERQGEEMLLGEVYVRSGVPTCPEHFLHVTPCHVRDVSSAWSPSLLMAPPPQGCACAEDEANLGKETTMTTNAGHRRLAADCGLMENLGPASTLRHVMSGL